MNAEAPGGRLAVGIEYDGTEYHGWQFQPHASSVQDELQKALSLVADQPVEVVVAGRTDAGVHAAGQVAHFDAPVERSMRSWLLGVNTNLPEDINLLWVRPVPADFSARYTATSRAYRYTILSSPVRSSLRRHRVWWVYHRLDHQAMHEAAQQLLGKHDFSAFRAAACQANTPVRNLTAISVVAEGDCIHIDVAANAFLHHMVRNIVGSLVKVGLGEQPVSWLADVLAARDRTQSGITAPASGLALMRVEYPADMLDSRSSAPRES